MDNHKDIVLNGKLITAEPATIGVNFRSLVNLRYTDTHLQSVGGMSRINTAVGTYTKVRNAFHYKKETPFAESHLLAQAYNPGLTASVVLKNDAAIPSMGDFSGTSLWTDSANSEIGQFSMAPGGQVVYCNGVDTCIWSGDEEFIAKFINFNPDYSFWYDFTDCVNNSLTDPANIATLKRVPATIDTNTKALYCLDNVVTDSSGNSHTLTNSNVTFDASDKVFGTHSAVFNGTTAELSIADDPDFTLSGGIYTIDARVKVDTLATVNPIYYQNTVDDYDSLKLYIDANGAVNLKIRSTVLVENCEDAWNESVAAGVTSTADASDKIVGSASAKLVVDATVGAGTILATEAMSSTNLSETNQIAMWIKASVNTSAGDMQLLLDNTASCTSPVETLDVPALTAGVWEQVVLTLAIPASDTAIISIGLNYVVDIGVCTIWLDDIKAVRTSALVSLITPNNTIATGTWYHVALVESGNNYYIFVGQNGGSGILKAETSNSNRPANYTGDIHIGYGLNTGVAEWLDGKIDEFRLSNLARWTTGYQVPLSAYSSSPQTFVWIASRRPADSFKFYLGTKNTSSATVIGYKWDGAALSALASLADGTSLGGKSFAQNGAISFDSTVATSKLKIIREVLAHYYLLIFDGLDDSVTVTQCTVSQPMQRIIDVWDGVKRNCDRFLIYTTSYIDVTTKILKEDYYSSDTTTYAQIGGLTSSQKLYYQSQERLQGFFSNLPDSSYINTTANTIIEIEYFNGQSYVSVGTIEDGTSTNAISMAQPGAITWQQKEENVEFPTTVNNTLEYFTYRIGFSKTLSVDVRVDYISGIPASKKIGNYKFPVILQGRLLLCGDMEGDKNKITCSAKDMPDVLNGFDSIDLYIGSSGQLTCGIELFSNFGSSIYSILLLFKDNATYIMAGQDIDSWANNTFVISNSIGCPAPHTLKAINLAVDPGSGINRTLAIWQGANGIYMSDGRAPMPIHNDIKEYFNPNDLRCIRSSKIGDSIGFQNLKFSAYHILIASGSSATTLNAEMVYDVYRNKWYEINRVSDLQYGVLVSDINGNPYNYGFLDTGYIEILDSGVTFDGADIVSYFQFGDFLLNDKLYTTTRIKQIKTVLVSKSNTTNALSITHYGDTLISGQSFTTSVSESGKRVRTSAVPQIFGDFLFHSLKYSMATNDEEIGFEPMAISLTYEVAREG